MKCAACSGVELISKMTRQGIVVDVCPECRVDLERGFCYPGRYRDNLSGLQTASGLVQLVFWGFYRSIADRQGCGNNRLVPQGAGSLYRAQDYQIRQ